MGIVRQQLPELIAKPDELGHDAHVDVVCGVQNRQDTADVGGL